MSFRDDFATRLKDYLEDDKDKEIIKDGHREIIFQYLYFLEIKIGHVKNPNFSFLTSSRRSHIIIENIEFLTKVNTKNNIIEVTKVVDNVVIPLDTIIIQEGELFALGCNARFTTEILKSYLRETFGEKLGLSE